MRRFASSRNLSLKVCKALFEAQRAHFGKLTQSKSGLAPKIITERQHLIYDKFAEEDPEKKEGSQQVIRFKKQPRVASASRNIS